MYVSVNEIHIDCKTLCSSVLNSRTLVSNKLNRSKWVKKGIFRSM